MRKLLLTLVVLVGAYILSSNVYATSGCCSWHEGVCGCDTRVGRQVCCDGQYSPSCGCQYIPPTPKCGLNAHYDTVKESCYCNTGYCVGVDKYNCVLLPSNAHCVTSPTDAWLCNSGYKEVGYSCVLIPKPKTLVPAVTTTHPPSPPSLPTSAPSEDYSYLAITLGGLGIIGLITYAVSKMVPWLISFVKNHGEVLTTLFWVLLIGIYILISSTSKKNSSKSIISNSNQKYNCSCSKTCPNMSCKEAYYQLNVCGCSQRDGDGDGIPCEAQCR